jgi:hypothetical protein
VIITIHIKGNLNMGMLKKSLYSPENLKSYLDAIRKTEEPEVFDNKFFQKLGFQGKIDNSFIEVLMELGFLSEDSKPTITYYRFLDETQSKKILAEAIRNVYSDLFILDEKANELNFGTIKNKMKMISEGRINNEVIARNTATFTALCELADFS